MTPNKEKIIVSLTSFPPAINFAKEAVKSILNGSVLPDKIILYLTFSEFGDSGIPKDILRLAEENPIFEIRDYHRNIKSYRKLVPALRDFPDAVIVTIDDDVWYHKDMLRDLLKMHKQFPEDVIAHRVKLIAPDKPYKKWKKLRWYHFLRKRVHLSSLILQTGVAGVLYPPGVLKKEMIDDNLFMDIAPTTDDIWFWAATVANGHQVIPVPFGKNKPKGLGKPKSLSLKNINFKSGEDRNSLALRNILNAFPTFFINFATQKK